MTVPKALLLSLMIGVSLIFGACAKESTNSADKRNVEKPGAETANAGLVNAIKNGKLANHQSTTIGNAFDSYKYLTKKEWKGASLQSGHFTVDFTGWFEPGTVSDNDIKGGVTGSGINVKFVINPDGSYYVFMVSKIESRSDGKVYGDELQDSAGILASIYANKKIGL